MIYTVAHRDANGHMTSKSYEAASRSELFKILKEQGIAPIRITEGEIKHIKSPTSNIKKIILSILSISAVISVFYFCFNQKSHPKKITVNKQPVARKTVNAPVKKPDLPKAEVKTKRFWEVDASQTNGFTEMQMRKWRFANRPAPSYTNNAALVRKKPSYAIFNHKCENLIAAYITMPPGEGVIGTPMLGDRFKQDFLKSIKDEIVINPDDSPEQILLKQDMIATKKDLKARMDAGEDITEIIRNTHEEFQILARYKQMLLKEVSKVKKDSKMTLEDVETFIEAANQMLESKGIAPIKLGPISKRLILRRQGLQ